MGNDRQPLWDISHPRDAVCVFHETFSAFIWERPISAVCLCFKHIAFEWECAEFSESKQICVLQSVFEHLYTRSSTSDVYFGLWGVIMWCCPFCVLNCGGDGLFERFCCHWNFLCLFSAVFVSYNSFKRPTAYQNLVVYIHDFYLMLLTNILIEA